MRLIVFSEFWGQIETIQQVRCLLLFTFCFNLQDGEESGLRMVECTFREMGCLAAVHPDEMAAHLDTQIHYHIGVSATSELCVAKSVSLLDSIQSVHLQKAFWEIQQRNISLNSAVMLKDLVAQNCHQIQIFQSWQGQEIVMSSEMFRLAVGHTLSPISWI